MKRFYHFITRKRNVRRMLAGMFLFVLFAEMGSHVVIDSQDPNAVAEALSCSTPGNVPAHADCPEQRRQRQETKNMMDEMTTHMAVLNSMTVPRSGISYRSPDNYYSVGRAVSRSITPPSQPPKHS